MTNEKYSTRIPHFDPHPLLRHIEQATPARKPRIRPAMLYAALCIFASVAVSVTMIVAVIGWLQ